MSAPSPDGSHHTVRDVLRERAIAHDLDQRAVDELARDIIRRYTPDRRSRRRRGRATTTDLPAPVTPFS